MTRKSADFLPGAVPAAPPAAPDRPRAGKRTDRHIDRQTDRHIDRTGGAAWPATASRAALPPDDDGLLYPLSPPPLPWPRVFPQL